MQPPETLSETTGKAIDAVLEERGLTVVKGNRRGEVKATPGPCFAFACYVHFPFLTSTAEAYWLELIEVSLVQIDYPQI